MTDGSVGTKTRKVVTILFADISGSTGLGQALDPESLQQLLARYFAEMKRVVKPEGRIVVGDVMFKDAADKARALAEYRDMEDEYQPTLDTFLAMFRDEGFTVETKQMADTVWIVMAELE